MEAGYYLRSKGKISGPFDVAGLQKLVSRQALSRSHEISTDRRAWRPAGEFAELFPAPAARAAGTKPARAAVEAPARAEPAVPEPPTVVETAVSYYYAQNGVAVGPVPMAVLKSLAQNGTLQATDLVWQHGRDVGAPAGQLSALASFYSVAHFGNQKSAADPPVNPEVLYRSAVEAGKFARGCGLAVGIMILVFLDLPLASMNGKTFWCWSAVGVPGSGAFVGYCVFFLLIGITLCIVSPLVQAAARGVVFMAISGAAALLFLINALTSDTPGSAVVAVLGIFLTPAFCAMLIGASRARRLNPPSGGARVSQGVFAGLTGCSGLLVGTVLLVESNGISGLRDAIVAAYVLFILSFATALAAGVLGIIASARRFSGGLNLAAMITGAGCPVFIVLSLLMFYLGFVDGMGLGHRFASAVAGPGIRQAPSASALFLLLFRMVVLFAGVSALAGVGLFDVLMAPAGRPRPPRRQPDQTRATAEALQHLR